MSAFITDLAQGSTTSIHSVTGITAVTGNTVPNTPVTSVPFSAHRSATKRGAEIKDVSFEFNPDEITPLPEGVQLDSIVDDVTESLHFNTPVTKMIWRTHFNSVESRAIIQDAFWWFFSGSFTKDLSSNENQNSLFDRMAQYFVKLFSKVPESSKDHFFDKYHDAVAQTVFWSYFQAFPRSQSLFNEEFQMEMIDTISEWVMGIRLSNPPRKHWRIEPSDMNNNRRFRGIPGDNLNRSTSSIGSSKSKSWSLNRKRPVVQGNHVLSHSQFVNYFLLKSRGADTRHLLTSLTNSEMECVQAYEASQPWSLKMSFTEVDEDRPLTVFGQHNRTIKYPKSQTSMSRSSSLRRGGAASLNNGIDGHSVMDMEMPEPETCHQLIKQCNKRRQRIMSNFKAKKKATDNAINHMMKFEMAISKQVESERKNAVRGDLHEFSNNLVMMMNQRKNGGE
eukprot:TRINITY_DN1699_c0_g1_i5.p1 TRINITY_DN1699_c0_g1~~TRINITY_DN1699_c0_g1_i5.p1  ORF type:complete len:449 (+),score=72.00 TRINITY_DN1699_c0_g1_i5:131-1477(+)